MNIYKKLLLSVGVAATALITSCDKKFDEINTNPNDPESVQTYGLMTTMQWYMADIYYDSWQGIRMKGLMTQHWTQMIYSDEDSYNFSDRTGTVSTYFNYNYIISQKGQAIIDMCEADPDGTSAYGDAAFQIASVQILQYILMLQNVETYGNVPYTEANDLMNFPKPAYDDQEFIYKDIIEKLTAINDVLAGCSTGWTGGDVIFGGDVEKWRKLGNSLRLRTAMRLSNYDASYASTQAAAAIADGVMESNDDSAFFQFTGPGSPNQAPIYGDLLSRIDFTMSAQFVYLLQGLNDTYNGKQNPTEGILDPRLSIFAMSPNQIAAGVDPMALKGFPYAMPPSSGLWSMFSEPTNAADTVAIYNLKTGDETDADTPLPLQSSFRTVFMDYANTALLVAEHNGNDRTYFEAGVQASLDMWGVSEVDAAEYLAAVLAKFDAADDEGKFELIHTQKYIHNFAHFDQEALHESIRTGYPTSLLRNGDVTAVLKGTTYNFDTENGEEFIERMLYPVSEESTNGDNLNDAISAMGGNAQDLPLIYSKNYKK